MCEVRRHSYGAPHRPRQVISQPLGDERCLLAWSVSMTLWRSCRWRGCLRSVGGRFHAVRGHGIFVGRFVRGVGLRHDCRFSFARRRCRSGWSGRLDGRRGDLRGHGLGWGTRRDDSRRRGAFAGPRGFTRLAPKQQDQKQRAQGTGKEPQGGVTAQCCTGVGFRCLRRECGLVLRSNERAVGQRRWQRALRDVEMSAFLRAALDD